MRDRQDTTLVHVNLRIPKDVLEYFKQYPYFTREMRRVLTQYVDEMKYATDKDA